MFVSVGTEGVYREKLALLDQLMFQQCNQHLRVDEAYLNDGSVTAENATTHHEGRAADVSFINPPTGYASRVIALAHYLPAASMQPAISDSIAAATLKENVQCHRVACLFAPLEAS